MAKTGIKGAAFESVVADVNRLVDEGKISAHELEAQLTAEDVRVLESKIQSALWYPLDTFGRLTEILLRKDGHGDFEYLIERGRRAAQRLTETGVYSQLSASVAKHGDRVGRVMVTIGPGMFRDTAWNYEVQIDETHRGFRIAAEISADFPDVCRYSVLGCIQLLSRKATEEDAHITSRRDSPTLMSFTGRYTS